MRIRKKDVRDRFSGVIPVIGAKIRTRFTRESGGESQVRIAILPGSGRKTGFRSLSETKKLPAKTAEFRDFLTIAKQNCKKPLTESRVPPRWTSPTRRWRLPPPTATVANIERQPVPPVKTGGTKAVPHYIVERLFDIVGF